MVPLFIVVRPCVRSLLNLDFSSLVGFTSSQSWRMTLWYHSFWLSVRVSVHFSISTFRLWWALRALNPGEWHIVPLLLVVRPCVRPTLLGP